MYTGRERVPKDCPLRPFTTTAPPVRDRRFVWLASTFPSRSRPLPPRVRTLPSRSWSWASSFFPALCIRADALSTNVSDSVTFWSVTVPEPVSRRVWASWPVP